MPSLEHCPGPWRAQPSSTPRWGPFALGVNAPTLPDADNAFTVLLVKLDGLTAPPSGTQHQSSLLDLEGQRLIPEDDSQAPALLGADVTGDELAELLIGTPNLSRDKQHQGAVSIFSMTPLQNLFLAQEPVEAKDLPHVKLWGGNAEYLGSSMLSVPALDSTGVPVLGLAAVKATADSSDWSGRVHWVSPARVNEADCPLTTLPSAGASVECFIDGLEGVVSFSGKAGTYLGASLSSVRYAHGNVSGIALGASEWTEDPSRCAPGRVYFFGRTTLIDAWKSNTLSLDLDAATATLTGTEDDCNLGSSVFVSSAGGLYVGARGASNGQGAVVRWGAGTIVLEGFGTSEALPAVVGDSQSWNLGYTLAFGLNEAVVWMGMPDASSADGTNTHGRVVQVSKAWEGESVHSTLAAQVELTSAETPGLGIVTLTADLNGNSAPELVVVAKGDSAQEKGGRVYILWDVDWAFMDQDQDGRTPFQGDCDDSCGSYRGLDQDNDLSIDCDDCDDQDPTRYPGAKTTPGDDPRDLDCDGNAMQSLGHEDEVSLVPDPIGCGSWTTYGPTPTETPCSGWVGLFAWPLLGTMQRRRARMLAHRPAPRAKLQAKPPRSPWSLRLGGIWLCLLLPPCFMPLPVQAQVREQRILFAFGMNDFTEVGHYRPLRYALRDAIRVVETLSDPDLGKMSHVVVFADRDELETLAHQDRTLEDIIRCILGAPSDGTASKSPRCPSGVTFILKEPTGAEVRRALEALSRSPEPPTDIPLANANASILVYLATHGTVLEETKWNRAIAPEKMAYITRDTRATATPKTARTQTPFLTLEGELRQSQVLNALEATPAKHLLLLEATCHTSLNPTRSSDSLWNRDNARRTLVIADSSPGQRTQESDTLKASLFTDALLRILRSPLDPNPEFDFRTELDGAITVEEAFGWAATITEAVTCSGTATENARTECQIPSLHETVFGRKDPFILSGNIHPYQDPRVAIAAKVYPNRQLLAMRRERGSPTLDGIPLKTMNETHGEKPTGPRSLALGLHRLGVQAPPREAGQLGRTRHAVWLWVPTQDRFGTSLLVDRMQTLNGRRVPSSSCCRCAPFRHSLRRRIFHSGSRSGISCAPAK